MEQIEIILRTTASSGKVTERLLAKFDTEKPATASDEVLQYSGLCIDPVKHQISYHNFLFGQSARKSLYQRADLSGCLERRAGGCEQCGVLYHRKYPPEAAEGYKERIYPDRVGSRIQVCRCPRRVISWDVFNENRKEV